MYYIHKHSNWQSEQHGKPASISITLFSLNSPKIQKIPQTLYQHLRDLMAPQVGLEPTTTRLTAECSAIELLRNIESGSDLLSRAVSSQVPSALKGLTSVFGMGTGGTPSSLPPEIVNLSCGIVACFQFPVNRYFAFLTP